LNFGNSNLSGLVSLSAMKQGCYDLSKLAQEKLSL